jgi:hypothetical protein
LKNRERGITKLAMYLRLMLLLILLIGYSEGAQAGPLIDCRNCECEPVGDPAQRCLNTDDDTPKFTYCSDHCRKGKVPSKFVLND